MTTKDKTTVSICLYGNRTFGFYCLASVNDGTQKLGTMYGKPPELGGNKFGTATIAIWTMQRELAEAGVSSKAPVAIHMDVNGCPKVSIVGMAFIPAFGSLKWTDGSESNVLISAEEVEAASEKGGS